MNDDLEQQLTDELGRVVWSLHTLGAIPLTDTHAAAARLAQQLHTGDDNQIAETVIDVLNLLWPHASPEDCGHAAWWRTPLGRTCARSLGRTDADEITHSVAAAMLGVTRGTIAQMVARGTLDRHPDGGVLRSSVLQRLAR